MPITSLVSRPHHYYLSSSVIFISRTNHDMMHGRMQFINDMDKGPMPHDSFILPFHITDNGGSFTLPTKLLGLAILEHLQRGEPLDVIILAYIVFGRTVHLGQFDHVFQLRGRFFVLWGQGLVGRAVRGACVPRKKTRCLTLQWPHHGA